MFVLKNRCELGQNLVSEQCPIDNAEVKVCQNSQTCVSRERLLDLCIKPHSPCQLCVLKSSGSKEEAYENILIWLCGQTKIKRQVCE